MKRVFVLALFACAYAAGTYAQAVNTTICAIVKSPQSFNGKMVQITGTVVVGFDQFIVKDPGGCGYPVDGIWIDYPEGTKGKAGPVAVVVIQPARNFSGDYTAPTRAAVSLDKNNKEFKQFDSLLAQPHNKGGSLCVGCARNEVTATLVGRLDSVEDASLQRDKTGKVISFGGFGNLNAYPARLMLSSVTGVTAKPVDYSKADEASKNEAVALATTDDFFDPVVAAQKTAVGMGANPTGAQLVKDADLFGKSSATNGVILNSGPTNEASAKYEVKGAKESTDGVLYNCIFNSGRLEGITEEWAILHMGQHISDLRESPVNLGEPPLYILEYNAWMASAAAAVGSGVKYVTLPGGILLWDNEWSAADRDAKMQDALKNYLGSEAALNR
jgi:hypothetical protein